MVLSKPLKNIDSSSALIAAQNVFEVSLNGTSVSQLDAKFVSDAALLSGENGLKSLHVASCQFKNISNLMRPLFQVVGV